MAKRGRPRKDQNIDIEQVRKLAEKGWTDAEMSDFFGVTRTTWHNWKKENTDFFNTLKDWKDKADRKVERSLYERATGYKCIETKVFNIDGNMKGLDIIKSYPPDTTACMAWLNNRKPEDWRYKKDKLQRLS